MDFQKIEAKLTELATEASRFGAEQALGIKTQTDQYVSDARVNKAMRDALETILLEHNLSFGPVHTERVN